jgi:hypothetical protein
MMGRMIWGIDLAELQILDELLIDLDRVDGKPLEIREVRIARTKVIDRQSSFRPELDGENIKKTLCDLRRIFGFRQIGQEYSELTIGKTCQNRFRSSTMCLDDRRYQQQA